MQSMGGGLMGDDLIFNIKLNVQSVSLELVM